VPPLDIVVKGAARIVNLRPAARVAHDATARVAPPRTERHPMKYMLLILGDEKQMELFKLYTPQIRSRLLILLSIQLMNLVHRYRLMTSPSIFRHA